MPPANDEGCATNNADRAADNVVSFHDTAPFPLTAKREWSYCPGRCKRVYVVEKTRMLECQDCKRTLDPFDYLMRWASEGDRRLGALKELDANLAKKNAELTELKNSVANAKSQLRRATASLAGATNDRVAILR